MYLELEQAQNIRASSLNEMGKIRLHVIAVMSNIHSLSIVTFSSSSESCSRKNAFPRFFRQLSVTCKVMTNENLKTDTSLAPAPNWDEN